MFPHILILFSCDRYSPAILLLRHFNVFRDLVSQMGSPSEQAGTNTEVASVIREFTEPVMEDEDTYCEQNSESDSVRFLYPTYTGSPFHFSTVKFFAHMKPLIGILHHI